MIIRVLFTVLIAFPATALAAQATAVDSDAISPNLVEGVLLLDKHTVASTSHLNQKYYRAEKHPANPVMRRSEPWEGVGPYLFGSRLMQDPATRLFRMWYIAYRFEDNHYRWGYATSPDGLHWSRPKLNVEHFGNEWARNCLPLGPHPEKGTRSIARDPRPKTPSERRYLGVRFTYEGEFVSFSPDGIHWKESASNPVWHVPSDMIHVMWDGRRNRFIAFYKVWELVGRKVETGNPDKSVPFTAYMPFFTPKELENGSTEFVGPSITFHPPGAATVETARFVLRSGSQGLDDGGGTSLSGEWRAKRVQGFAESEDGVHWTNEQIVMRADSKDPPTANIQYLFVIPYGGYYLGFPTLHDEVGQFRIQFAWSADGLKWQRPWREPWLDVGPEGAFDHGMVLGPADPIITDSQLWFPYGGFPILHNSSATNWESAIGLATTRLDGFSAWEAGDDVGVLVTQSFRCNGGQLFVNADASGGTITVEVLDERGMPVPGFETGSCHRVSTDTLTDKLNGWILWEGSKLGQLRGRQIQLRFILKKARLYSFRIGDEATMKLPVPRATDR